MIKSDEACMLSMTEEERSRLRKESGGSRLPIGFDIVEEEVVE